jgi:Methyl-accepting chemotaxis protein
MPEKHRTRFSIRRKLLLAFVILGILSSFAVGVFAYVSVYKYEIQKLKNQLLSIVTISSYSIDGDLHSQIKPGDENTEIYKDMLAQLRQYKKTTGMTFLYTYVPYTDKSVKFVIDTDDTKEQAKIGKEYPNDNNIKQALNGQPSITENPETDEYGTFISAFAPIYDSNRKVVAVIGADLSIEEIQKMQLTLMFIIAGGVVFSILLSILLSSMLSGFIAKPILRLVNALDDVVKRSGDLTQTVNIKTGDELELLANAANNLLANIRSMVGVIRNVSKNVKAGTAEIAVAVDNSSEAAETITKAMEEISSSAMVQLNNINKSTQMLEHLSSEINTLTYNSSNIGTSAKAASTSADNCIKAVKDLNEKAETSNEILKTASVTAQRLEGNSEEIVKITNTIGSISEQTNLLALNAAIEAARAGEQGKGFTIVANEIRKLAEMTTESAKVISRYINEIKTQSNETSLAVKGVVNAVTCQFGSIDNTNSTLTSINTVIEKITESLENVNSAIKNVFDGNNSFVNFNIEIQQASEQMAAVTQEINASQEEQLAGLDNLRNNIYDLNQLADKLESAVGKFII